MKMIQIDLSPFPPETQEELRKRLLALAWDGYITPGHPELLTVAWNRKEPIETVFPELAPHLAYK